MVGSLGAAGAFSAAIPEQSLRSQEIRVLGFARKNAVRAKTRRIHRYKVLIRSPKCRSRFSFGGISKYLAHRKSNSTSLNAVSWGIWRSAPFPGQS